MSDLDNNRRLDPRDSDGISTGTIAANGTASNSSGTTTGQTSTGTGGSAPGKK